MSTLTNRSDKYLSAWANVAVPLSTLIATPILLDRLGPAGLGLVYVALAISRIVASLDLGLGGLAIPRSAALLTGGPEPIWRYLRDALRHLSAVATVLALAGVGAVAAGLRLLDAGAGTSLALIVTACGAAFALQMFTLVNGVLYAASGFKALALFATIGSAVYLAAIAIWVRGGDETLVMLVTAAQYLVVALLGVAYVHRRAPVVDPGTRPPAPLVASRIISWRMQLIALGGVAIWQAPTLVASRLLEPAAVTSVGVGQQYASVVRVAGLSFAGYFLSRIALAGDDASKMTRALSLNRRWVMLCAASMVLAAGAAPIAVPLWLGEVPPGSVGGSVLAAIASGAVISSLVGTSYLRSIGNLTPEFRFVVALLASAALAIPFAAHFRTPTSVWAVFATSYTVIGVAYAAWGYLLLGNRLRRVSPQRV